MRQTVSLCEPRVHVRRFMADRVEFGSFSKHVVSVSPTRTAHTLTTTAALHPRTSSAEGELADD